MPGKHDKRVRLGRGEFQYKEGFNVSGIEPELNLDGPTKERMHQEALFMRAVFEVETEAQNTLESVFEKLLTSTSDGLPPPIPANEIAAWCSRFHLDAPWCREFAEQLIEAWWLESQPDGDKYSHDALKQRAAAQEFAGQPFQEQRLTIDFGFWPVTQMTRSEFYHECRRTLDTRLKEFCDQVEGLALAAGMERTHEKRETDHFYWLARNRVKGESAADIKQSSAKLEGMSIRAITKAIAALAKRLGLPS